MICTEFLPHPSRRYCIRWARYERSILVAVTMYCAKIYRHLEGKSTLDQVDSTNHIFYADRDLCDGMHEQHKLAAAKDVRIWRTKAQEHREEVSCMLEEMQAGLTKRL